MSSVAVYLDRLLEPLAATLSPEVAAKVADLRRRGDADRPAVPGTRPRLAVQCRNMSYH